MQVFADDESSQNPIHVPREWIWPLERRTVYFASSASAMSKGKHTLQKVSSVIYGSNSCLKDTFFFFFFLFLVKTGLSTYAIRTGFKEGII
jgi:hypothetical protein